MDRIKSITAIVAVDRRGAIGKGGAVPWRYPADMKFFRRQTTGHACVTGRGTWESFPKPLPNRLNIVLSRTMSPYPAAAPDGGAAAAADTPSVIVLRDRQEVLSLAGYLREELFVIGGAQVYEAFLGDIDRWIVTEIPETVEGADVFMPKDFLRGFTPYDTEELEPGLRATFYRRDRAGGGGS